MKTRLAATLLILFALFSPSIGAQAHRRLVLIDTDIGDDIDDAFAVSLALRSPELKILGITTAFGQTGLRAQLTTHLLSTIGRSSIPVVAGIATPPRTAFTQQHYAKGGDAIHTHAGSAPDFILDQIRRHPGQITLIAIGPLTNLGAAIDQDPATFHELKRIVMMGGSIYKGYGSPHPEPEWNIVCDIPAARKVFASGVPIFMMPLDATMLKLDETRRNELFAHKSPLNAQLSELYSEWSQATKQPTPTLFDPMAVAFATHPDLCPTTALHLTIDDKGLTQPSTGAPNAEVCLQSDSDAFFHYYLSRLTGPVSR
jgi:purine nucleosidase